MIRRIAMVSLRAGFSPLFLCLRASRSVLSPPIPYINLKFVLAPLLLEIHQALAADVLLAIDSMILGSRLVFSLLFPLG